MSRKVSPRPRKRVEAEYDVPFLGHATMEPQNCTAHVTGDKVEIWVPTQNGEAALAAAAKAAGVPPRNVVVHKMMLGGGFGRRGAMQDFVRQAVLIAKEVGRPVKTVWTREEDMRHDFYRPVAMARMTAGLDAAGMPVAWHVRMTGQSVLGSLQPMTIRSGLDRHFQEGFAGHALRRSELSRRLRDAEHPCAGRLLALREPHAELLLQGELHRRAGARGGRRPLRVPAQAARQTSPRQGNDRRARCRGPQGRMGNAAAEGRPSRHRAQRGLWHLCAQVVEASVGDDGEVRVHRVVCAIDPGHVVNPLTVEMQTESAVVYGLTAALYGEITIKDGRVEQSNFNDYRMLRMDEMPKVETIVMPSGGFWGGVGEPPVALSWRRRSATPSSRRPASASARCR